MIYKTSELKETARNGALPPSIIFHSLSRESRRETAMAVASSLTGNRDGADEMVSGIMYVEKNESGNLTADAVKDGTDHLQKTPYGRKANVLVLDDAETMTEEASNSLLKALEEPAGSSYCFLLTSDYDSLLPTIRSRCAYFRLAEADAEDYSEYVKRSCGAVSADEGRFFNRCRGIVPDEGALKILRAVAESLRALILSSPRIGAVIDYADKLFPSSARSKEDNALRFDVFLCMMSTFSFDMILYNMGLEEKMTWLDDKTVYNKLDFSSRFPIIVEETAEIFSLKKININMKLTTVSLLVDFFGKENV